MPAAARQGESGGTSCRAFPGYLVLSRIACACALLAGLLWLPAARAGALYRCIGAGGETVFSSSPSGYQQCRKLGSYANPTHRAAASARAVRRTASPAPGAMPHAAAGGALTSVEGSVATTARKVPAGTWNYRENASPAPAAPAPADRVLRGAVYRVVKADGSVEYTNLRPVSSRGHAVTTLFTYIATCAACDLHSTVDWRRVRLNFDAFADAIRAASAESGVEEAFLRAVIHAESAFNPNALSLKGAQGLMQLMPATASDMGVLDAFDARQNIRGGARYLAQLLRNFGGDERLAAAAYNAGPGAVQRYRGVPPFAETQVYVQRVGELRRRYGAVVGGTPGAVHGTGAP